MNIASEYGSAIAKNITLRNTPPIFTKACPKSICHIRLMSQRNKHLTRPMNQRHKHLLRRTLEPPNRIFHGRVATFVPLVPNHLKDLLGRMTLLVVYPCIGLQDS